MRHAQTIVFHVMKEHIDQIILALDVTMGAMVAQDRDKHPASTVNQDTLSMQTIRQENTVKLALLGT